MTKEEKIAELINIRDNFNYTLAPREVFDDAIKALEQEQQTFKWCTDCKEYDQEKHCCHRWSKAIRNTVEEMKQEQEPRKGHWLCRPHVYGVTYCSICDFELKIDNTNYCPHCGAKMESEADNGNDD